MSPKKNGRWVRCQVCPKQIYVQPSKEALGYGKYCSRRCEWEAEDRYLARYLGAKRFEKITREEILGMLRMWLEVSKIGPLPPDVLTTLVDYYSLVQERKHIYTAFNHKINSSCDRNSEAQICSAQNVKN